MTEPKPGVVRRATSTVVNKTVQELAAVGLVIVTIIAVSGLVYAVIFHVAGHTDPLTSVAGIGIGALAVLSGAKRESDE